MEVIKKGKGEGKTRALIELSAENKHIIVCRGREEVIRIFEYSKQLGLEIPVPITFYNFRTGGRLGGRLDSDLEGYMIDDLDAFLEMMTFSPISYVTISK